MAEGMHPFYELNREANAAGMRQRLDLAEAMLRARTHLSDLDGIRQEVMDEFEIVLTQMPYVAGTARDATSLLTDLDNLSNCGKVGRWRACHGTSDTRAQRAR